MLAGGTILPMLPASRFGQTAPDDLVARTGFPEAFDFDLEYWRDPISAPAGVPPDAVPTPIVRAVLGTRTTRPQAVNRFNRPQEFRDRPRDLQIQMGSVPHPARSESRRTVAIPGLNNGALTAVVVQGQAAAPCSLAARDPCCHTYMA